MSNQNKSTNNKLILPSFLPDATYGSVKNLSFKDVQDTGTQGIVTTTLHIEQKIGSEYVKNFGGIKKFFGWNGFVLTDSGGWQVFSLINSKRANKKNKITELGCSFIDERTGKYNLLTPESSQVIQHNLMPDAVTVLDDPIIPNASLRERKESVRINTAWAKRSKKKFLELNHLSESEFHSTGVRLAPFIPLSELERPLIGTVVQGGEDFKLRKISAEELIEIGFDLYNFGGLPLLSEITWKTDYPQGFHREMLHFVCELLPKDKIKYAMGVGQPDDIAFCVEVGWNLFDTVLPTRNARHGYLYVSEGNGDQTKEYKSLRDGKTMKYDIQHLRSERYKYDESPVDSNCGCECCSTTSRAYLRHLIRIKEPAGMRLATIHNLTFYQKWMNQLVSNG
ncbi:MAG: tRNA guanosine(34) transglycosylase Tgt [Candidatus Dojkabacteria bacterium]